MAAVRGEQSIKPIDKSAVHRICSGQVVLDLATAVKELVENSLDAGADRIDIRLKDHGAELIEVADNGCGVSPENYQGLTLKYHTSKISKFADLQFLSSFGFRGEALSSLCALAKVIVVTRTKDEPVASRLEYDHSGLIVSQESVARSVGTTVTVAKLFSPLPVRFKEFRRDNNIRREYGRLLSVLQAYALIAKGVRLICSNQTGRAGRTVVVQTQGNLSMRDNVVTVFGTKTAASMEWLELSVSDKFSVEGFMSKPGAGCGRPSGDRQFFYVNGRPVDMPKVSKVLNELYRSFNSQQFPMLVLNLILPTTAYDVNVTPDKRKLFLHSESELMVSLRESLEKVYAPNKYSYVLNNLENGPLSQKVSATAKKLEGSRNPVDLVVPSNFDEGLSSDDETELRNSRESLPGVPKMAGESKSSLSTKAPLNLLSFQHKVSKGFTDKKSDCESGMRSVSSGQSRKTHLNIPSGQKFQATLSGFVSHKKGTSDYPGEDLLSEEPLLKRWRPPSPTEKEIGGVDRDHDSLSKETDDFGNPGGCGLQAMGENSLANSGFEDGSCGRTTGEARMKNPELEDSGALQETGKASMEKSEDSGGLQETTEACTATTEFESSNLSPSGLVADRDAFSKCNLKILGNRMLPCSSTGSSSKPPCRSSIDVEGQTGSESVDIGSKVAEARQKLGLHKVLGDKPSLACDTDVDEVQPTRLPANVSIETRVDHVKGATPNVEQAAPGGVRQIVEFNMDKLHKKFKLGLLQGQPAENLRRKQKVPRKRSCFAAATLNGVGKEGEKEAVLDAATKELERSFNKADFKRMKVLGQFNLGFILAKIDQDVYIVDQHASDEKYNFERLSRTTVLNRQPLLRPLQLELSASEEMTVLCHMETFRQNGFGFLDNEDAPAGQRLQLSAVPFSQNVTFGVGDVQELISLLAAEPVMSFECSSDHDEGPSDHGHLGKRPRKASSWLPRPSRVRSMLASRACRSSVMIGDPLSKNEMQRILSHLSGLDAPWNCPHGRPTMRHLVDLTTLHR